MQQMGDIFFKILDSIQCGIYFFLTLYPIFFHVCFPRDNICHEQSIAVDFIQRIWH